jgi:8-oxo-dGTP pyrophosphatase MutT (NUDIX family)
MPEAWPARILAVAGGEVVPAVPRPAATVLLTRDGTRGLEVYLLRRRTSMAFAAGMYAYPGGAVDPRDAGPGPEADRWASRLGSTPEAAQAIVRAAVRETFEESGVLLAGPDGAAGPAVADVSGPSWREDRAALEAHQLSFAEFLARRGLTLRGDLLAPWARWITPEFEERRFDTWFFLAAVPEGQRTQEVPGEADRVVWLRPADALAAYARGEMALMPPQLVTLRELTRYPDTASALTAAERRVLDPVQARARIDAGRITVCWPGHDLTMESRPVPNEASEEQA